MASVPVGCGQLPHVGDQGQRYQVTFFDPSTGTRKTLGWCEDPYVAKQMRKMVVNHPHWLYPEILDRQATQEDAK